jgi:hypothetical protein
MGDSERRKKWPRTNCPQDSIYHRNFGTQTPLHKLPGRQRLSSKFQVPNRSSSSIGAGQLVRGLALTFILSVWTLTQVELLGAASKTDKPVRSMSSLQQALDVAKLDRERILKLANEALDMAPVAITDHAAKMSEGGIHDFYSNGDYWWPDPNKPDGLPYIQRDGQSNPDNFSHHRLALQQLRDAVAALGAAYALEGQDKYA